MFAGRVLLSCALASASAAHGSPARAAQPSLHEEQRLNNAKMDAALVSALRAGKTAADATLTVFIEVAAPLTVEQNAHMKRLDINLANGARVLSATLCPEAIASLSRLPWVLRLSLAQMSRPLSPPRQP